MAESIEVKIEATAESIEVKPEPGIKLEPEDDVDTIEYTPIPSQLAGICIPKVEKVELNSDEDEVDDPEQFFNQIDNRQICFGTSNRCAPQSAKSSKKYIAEAKQNGNESPDSGPKGIGNKCYSRNEPEQKTQHKCPECGHAAPTPSILQIHMRNHTGERPFPCKSCPKRFKQKVHLQYHMKVHVTKNSLNCSNCWQIFETKRELLDHESSCKQRRYECHLCKKYAALNISDLKIHTRKHNGVRPYKCGECSMKFAIKSNLKKHIETHTNPRPLKFRCLVCARLFLNQSEKDAHEMNCKCRRYECYLCQSNKSYLKLNLQTHIRSHHIGERPYKCSLCKKCYPCQAELNRHIKKTHQQ